MQFTAQALSCQLKQEDKHDFNSARASTQPPTDFGSRGRMTSWFARLSSTDLSNLRLETLSSPFHFGGLAILEAKPLLDASGRLRLHEIRDRLDQRLTRVPALRRRVYFPGPLRGRALWVDDDRFDIAHHVLETAIEPPGGEVQLLETAARQFGELLDRSRPLWELWFLTGLNQGRIGVLLKLHHAVADGMAAVAIMGSLFDFEPDAPEPGSASWSPEPIPKGWPLLADNLRSKGRALRRAAASLAHPVRRLRGVGSFVREAARTLQRSRAPRTSLNERVRPGRRIRFLRLDLEAVKDRAHACGAKVNDVVLDLFAGGLRELLVSRGEQVSDLELITSVAVSLRPSDEAQSLGNQVGILSVPLPAREADVQRRLDLIAAATRQAKADQRSAAIPAAVGGLAATPIAQYFMDHQHWVNVFSTNLVGPPVPVFVLGARILDILPVILVAGNVALALCAISYAGGLYLVVTADATAFPDLDLMTTGMQQAWHELAGSRVT